VKAVRARRCPTAFTLGTILAVWTTKAINAAPNLDGNGKAKLCFVDLALFLMMRIAASACGVWEPPPKMFSSTPRVRGLQNLRHRRSHGRCESLSECTAGYDQAATALPSIWSCPSGGLLQDRGE
jgi:hypothetical protein